MLKAVRSCRKYATNSTKSQSLPTGYSVVAKPSQRQYSPELANFEPLPVGSKKAISLKRTEPASASNIVFSKFYLRNATLDPNHRFFNSKNPYHACPSASSDLFSAKIIPNGLLSHADADTMPPFEDKPSPSSPLMSKYGSTPQGQLIRHRADYERDDILFTCFMVVCGQSAVHKSAVIRSRTKRRILEALRLIATRGAKSSKDGQRVEFSINEAHGGSDKKEWLLNDWTYVLFAKLEAYRAPWPILVTALRDTLDKLNSRAEISMGNSTYGADSAQRRSNSNAKSQARLSQKTSPPRVQIQEQSQDRSRIRGENQTGTLEPKKSGQSHSTESNNNPRQRALKLGNNPVAPPHRPFSTTASISATSSARSSSIPTGDINSNNDNGSSKRKDKVTSRSHFERRDIRAEVILGQYHENRKKKGYLQKFEMWPSECMTVELKGDDRTFGAGVSSRIEKHLRRLRRLRQLEQPVEWRLWAGQDSEDLYSLSEHDFDPRDSEHESRHQDQAQTTSGAPSEDLAEGWVLVPVKGGQDQDLTPYIAHLLDAKTVLRFLHPNLPHHAGRGYERDFRTNWVNKNDKFVRYKVLDAVKERRWRRVVLNASWNMGDYSDVSEEEDEDEDYDDGEKTRSKSLKNKINTKTREQIKKYKGNTADLDWLLELKKKEEARQQIAFERENDLIGDGDGKPDPAMDNALLDRRMPWWTPPRHPTYHDSDYSNPQSQSAARGDGNSKNTTNQGREQEVVEKDEYKQETGSEQDHDRGHRWKRRKWSDRLDETKI